VIRILLVVGLLLVAPPGAPAAGAWAHPWAPDPGPGYLAERGVNQSDPDVLLLAGALLTCDRCEACALERGPAEAYHLAAILVNEAQERGWGLYGAFFLGALCVHESGCRQWAVGSSGEVCVLQVIPGRYERPPAELLAGSLTECVRTAAGILWEHRTNRAWGNRGRVRFWWGHYNGGCTLIVGYAKRVAAKYRSLLRAALLPCEWWDEGYPEGYRWDVCRQR